MTGSSIPIAVDAGDKFRAAFQIDSLPQAQGALNNLDGLWNSSAHDFPRRDHFDEAAEAVKKRFESGSYKPGTLVQDTLPPKDAPAEAPAVTRHIASATTWKAICVEPDWCKVDGKPIPFDSFATINQEDRASPNVKARGVPVYRLGDTHKGTQANAGAHVVSQTSQGSGYVKVLHDDQHGVKANGIPVARDKSPCLINCDANGVGGALGMLQTDYKTMFRARTQEDWKADRQYFEDAKKYADEEGKRIGRELDKAKAELDKTSWYRPSQWAQRDELKQRIGSLESQLQARGRDAIYYRDQMNHAFVMAYPEAAGGAVVSAGPSWTEQREIGRQVEMQRRNEVRLDAATQSPFAMAGAGLAEAAGGNADAMAGAAQIADGIPQGRGGAPRTRAASGSTRQGSRQPKGDGTYVRPKSLYHTTTTAGAAHGVLGGINPDFLNPQSRFGKAFYVAEKPGTTVAELAHHGATPSTGIRFSVDHGAMNVLDLTNPNIASAWGYNGGPITAATRAMGSQAQAQGYNAIRFFSERAAGEVNYAIISDFNQILKPVMVTPAGP